MRLGKELKIEVFVVTELHEDLRCNPARYAHFFALWRSCF